MEDLEEALRRIVVLLSVDNRHVCCERDDAALTVALDQLGVPSPHPA